VIDATGILTHDDQVKLSKKSEYAVRALIEIARREDSESGWHQISQIASTSGIPEKFLEQILLTLKKSGYLKSRRGIDGGYALSQTAAQIRLNDIISVLEGRMLSGLQIEKDADEAVQVFRDAIGHADEAAAKVLEQYTLEELVRLTNERRQQRTEAMEFHI
jgi:Rrf2 family protein